MVRLTLLNPDQGEPADLHLDQLVNIVAVVVAIDGQDVTVKIANCEFL